MKGKFIVLEGVDGSGKTSLAARLAQPKGAWVTFEPTDGPVGRTLRSGGLGAIPPAAEALLFAADRAVHTQEISARLDAGTWVVCDRYMGSTVAYQAAQMGDDADWDWLCGIQKHSVIEPDAVILLDVDPELSMSRVGLRGEERSRFEKTAFQKEVRKAYLKLADMFGYIVIDASADADAVYARAAGALKERGIDVTE